MFTVLAAGTGMTARRAGTSARVARISQQQQETTENGYQYGFKIYARRFGVAKNKKLIAGPILYFYS
jgi:hypothetical protein